MSTMDQKRRSATIRTTASLVGIAMLTGALAYYIRGNPPKSKTRLGQIEQPYSQLEPSLPSVAPSKKVAVTASPQMAVPIFPHRPTPAYTERQTYAHELITALLELTKKSEKLNDVEIREVNRTLMELRQLGAAALPAIEEYMESMQDIDLADRPEPKSTDYITLRAGLIDTLHQIGGAEAVNIMVRTLESTADAVEIAMLAKSLEGHAAGEYRPEVVAAVEESLAMALKTDADQNVDHVELLFAASAYYGNGSLANDLESTYRRWKPFSAMALAKLPDGAGVPALVRLVVENQNGRQGKGSPLQMLAQASRDYLQAGEALVQLADTGELTDKDWTTVATTLGGEEFRFRSRFFRNDGGGKLRLGKPSEIFTGLYLQAPYSWTDAEIDQRIQLIDELSEIAPLNSVNELQESRMRLLEWKTIDLINGRRQKR